MTNNIEPQEDVDSVNKKLSLISATLTAVLTVLLAPIVILFKLHWGFALMLGIAVGVGCAMAHNWMLERIAFKYGYDLEYNAIENLYKKDQPPQKQVFVYIEEPEVVKDPRYHRDTPKDFY